MSAGSLTLPAPRRPAALAWPAASDITLALAVGLPLAVEIARIPEDIRGYGHVKERHLQAARKKWFALMDRWRAPAQAPRRTA